MSVVTILVSLSQAFRVLANKMRNKAIIAIKDRIAKVEDEQVELEEHRSKLMIQTHNTYYEGKAAATTAYNEALARIQADFEAKLDKLDKEFQENKRTVALVSKGASVELQSELAMLRSELDALTK